MLDRLEFCCKKHFAVDAVVDAAEKNLVCLAHVFQERAESDALILARLSLIGIYVE